MKAALSPDMLATDLAYYLVRKGVGLFLFLFSFPLSFCLSSVFSQASQKLT